METRNIQFWAQLHTFPDKDRLTREDDHSFLGDEDEFVRQLDEQLAVWIEDHKRFGLRDYGWKYTTPE